MATRERGARPRRRLVVAVWIVVQVVATLILLEAALRLVRPLHAGLDALLYLPSLETRLSDAETTAELLARTNKQMHPGRIVRGFVLNSRGLRTHEYVLERGPGIRVVALGDSFTWGALPHRHTWPFRLQAVLRRTLDRRDVEVISLGVPAVGPQFYLRMWELEGRRLQPDLVVLGFFVGNDLTDEAGKDLQPVDHGWLVEHSLVVRAVRNLGLLRAADMIDEGGLLEADSGSAAEGQALGFEIPELVERVDTRQPKFSEKAFLRIEWKRMQICIADNRPQLMRLIRRVGPVLEELDRSVRASGAELVVFLIPDQFQIEDQLAATLLDLHGVDPSRFARTLPQRRLVQFFEVAGIRHIDGLRRFRSRATVEPLYLPRDTHWNAAGNQLAAKMITDYLLEEGLVAAPAALGRSAQKDLDGGP